MCKIARTIVLLSFVILIAGCDSIKSQSGYIAQYTFDMTEFVDTDSGYLEYQRTSYCNSLGVFVFNDLADGEYYITTTVTWEGGYPLATQGGLLMKRIAVSGGETKSVFVLAE